MFRGNQWGFGEMEEKVSGKSEKGVDFPEKMFYKIGEVSQILKVKPFVIRYWESEFKQLRPGKNGTGQRVYRKKDILLLQRIRELLYEELYTIPGARKRLQKERLEAKKVQAEAEEFLRVQKKLQEHKKKLKGIRTFLEDFGK